MRISDWSSDVCSSDLLDFHHRTRFAILVPSLRSVGRTVRAARRWFQYCGRTRESAHLSGVQHRTRPRAGTGKAAADRFPVQNSTYMPIRIQTYGSFFKERRANVAMVSGVVFGIAVLIFLNFLFFSITGHREFIWLGVAQGCFALNTVLAEGYIAIFFLSDRPLDRKSTRLHSSH